MDVTKVDAGSFLTIVLVGAIAAVIVSALPKRYAPPVVVLEIVFGIIVGPQVLGLADVDSFVRFFSNLGLGMLFFFAGYEIDFDRIRGKALTLAVWGWALSIALAYGIGGALAAAGIVLSFLYTGSALATTAIGTLIPILRDEDELRTRFGTFLLAAGAIGEFGPILLLTLVLSTQDAINRALPLLLFIALAIVIALVSVRTAPVGWGALERSIEASSQLAVRLAALLVFGLAALAAELGLDVVLGGFVAGMITRMAVRGHEVTVLESKLSAVGFGLLIPFFFTVSGIELQPRRARHESRGNAEAADVPRLVPRRPRAPGAAALPGRASAGPRPVRARHLFGDGPAARRRDHRGRGPGRPHAFLDRSSVGRGGDRLDGRVPVRRPDAAVGSRRSRGVPVGCRIAGQRGVTSVRYGIQRSPAGVTTSSWV